MFKKCKKNALNHMVIHISFQSKTEAPSPSFASNANRKVRQAARRGKLTLDVSYFIHATCVLYCMTHIYKQTIFYRWLLISTDVHFNV